MYLCFNSSSLISVVWSLTGFLPVDGSLCPFDYPFDGKIFEFNIDFIQMIVLKAGSRVKRDLPSAISELKDWLLCKELTIWLIILL